MTHRRRRRTAVQARERIPGGEFAKRAYKLQSGATEMSRLIITEEDHARQHQAIMDHLRRGMKEAREKQEAREAYEKSRCPHCGRVDPLPSWLQ